VLPERGRAWPEIEAALAEAKCDDMRWREGRLPVYVFWLDEETSRVAREAYAMYFSENGLGTGRAFKSLEKLEADVVATGLELFAAPPGAGGSFTSGGTESLFLAMKTARDAKGAARPNAVMPVTAHASLDKHGHYLGIEVRRTPMRGDFRADLEALASAIDADTVLLVGSAPGYTHGVFDPLPEMGALAQQRELWLHVDACWGGFLSPFAKQIGYPVPPFDFSVAGVTSLSADLHKYGMAAKGASLFLLRDAALKRHQVFRSDRWPRGVYATDTFLGTRPGGAVAAAWAVLQHLGTEGYRRVARLTMQTRDRLTQGIEAIHGLEVVRPQESSIVLYRSADPALDINAVAAALGARGWFVGRAVDPVAIHLAVNPVHAVGVEQYLGDLAEVVAEARARPSAGILDRQTY